MSVFHVPVTAGIIEAAGTDEFDKDAEHFLTRYILERLIREKYPGADPRMYPREELLPASDVPLPVPDDDVYRDVVRMGLLRVDKDPRGRPYAGFLPGGCCVSISHCRYAAAAAVGNDVCGIDVERRFDWNEKLAFRVFHPSERRILEKSVLSLSEKRDILGKIWSRKEAYLKCLGTGLFTDVRSICVVGADSRVYDRQVSAEKVKIDGKSWYFTERQNERYTLCICSHKKNIMIQTLRP